MPTCPGGPRYASMDLPVSSHPYLPLHAKYKHHGLMVLILCETGNGPSSSNIWTPMFIEALCVHDKM